MFLQPGAKRSQGFSDVGVATVTLDLVDGPSRIWFEAVLCRWQGFQGDVAAEGDVWQSSLGFWRSGSGWGLRNGDPDGGLVWFRTVFFTGDAGNGLGDCLVYEVLGVYVEGGEGGLEEV